MTDQSGGGPAMNISSSEAKAGHKPWLGAAITFAALFLACYIPILIAKQNATITPLWPANALALVILLRAPRFTGPRWDLRAAIAAAMVCANLIGGAGLPASLWFTFANGIEILTAVLTLIAIDRLRKTDRPAGISAFWRIFIASAVASSCGAVVGAAGLTVIKHQPFILLCCDWFISAALSMMTVAPLGLLMRSTDIARLRSLSGFGEALFWFVAVAGTLYASARASNLPLVFMVTPVVVLAAARLRAIGAAIAIAAIAFCGAVQIWHGAGPMAAMYTPAERLVLLQLFLLCHVIVGMLTAMNLDIRDALLEALRGEHARTIDQASAKSRLLTNVSHEIRTPLNVIQGLVEALPRRPSIVPEDKALLDDVIGASRQLQTLAHDLLEAARTQSGAIVLAPAWIEAGPIARDAAQEAHAALGAVQAIMQFEIAEGLVVWADPARLRQIVQNLASNAIKYAGFAGPIIIAIRVIPGATRIETRDRGPGFAAAALHTAFEPFAPFGPKSSGARASGVGLSVVKQLAQAHGGKAGVHSTPHVETCVWVELPLEGAPGALAAKHAAQEQIDPDEVFGP
jgi:signal transduction histidine kinase